MKQALKTLLLTLASVLFALLLAEFIIRLFAPVRNVGPSFSEYDPVYGKRLKKSFTCERITPEFRFRFTTNSLGFRGPEPTRFPARGILFLGDSFTEGYGVDDGKEFPALVRAELNKTFGVDSIPVVNCGIGDAGQGRWLLFLKNEAKRYQPRLVVLQLMQNDFEDNVLDKLYSLDSLQHLKALPPPEPPRQRLLQTVIEAVPGLSSSHLVGFARDVAWDLYYQREVDAGNTEGAQPQRFDVLTLRLIEGIIHACNTARWNLLVLSVGIEGERLEKIRNLLNSNQVPYIVVPFNTARPDLYYRIDWHWNEKGNEFVANQVLDAIAVAGIFQQ